MSSNLILKANVDKHMVDEHNITGFQYYKDYIAEVKEPFMQKAMLK